jgi:hypothetical protein
MTVLRFLAVAMPLVVLTSCAAPSARDTSSGIEQMAEADLATRRDALARDDAFVDELAEIVRSERRDSAWADQKEQSLRAAYRADPSVPQGAFTDVDCRRTRCSLTITGSRMAPEAFPAIDQWIAWGQPCAYVITDRTARKTGDVRIFLQCTR